MSLARSAFTADLNGIRDRNVFPVHPYAKLFVPCAVLRCVLRLLVFRPNKPPVTVNRPTAETGMGMDQDSGIISASIYELSWPSPPPPLSLAPEQSEAKWIIGILPRSLKRFGDRAAMELLCRRRRLLDSCRRCKQVQSLGRIRRRGAISSPAIFFPP